MSVSFSLSSKRSKKIKGLERKSLKGGNFHSKPKPAKTTSSLVDSSPQLSSSTSTDDSSTSNQTSTDPNEQNSSFNDIFLNKKSLTIVQDTNFDDFDIDQLENIGDSILFEESGWTEGKSIGKTFKSLTEPVTVKPRVAGIGLGNNLIDPSSSTVSRSQRSSQAYKDAVLSEGKYIYLKKGKYKGQIGLVCPKVENEWMVINPFKQSFSFEPQDAHILSPKEYETYSTNSNEYRKFFLKLFDLGPTESFFQQPPAKRHRTNYSKSERTFIRSNIVKIFSQKWIHVQLYSLEGYIENIDNSILEIRVLNNIWSIEDSQVEPVRPQLGQKCSIITQSSKTGKIGYLRKLDNIPGYFLQINDSFVPVKVEDLCLLL